ncbi:hypothetical protein D9758_003459 [Tetrapyrgos nigripes]|uniref:Alpha/beta hydrolase fold-3 domain-containing protein n=1 Tax=Tetrapyrgos nigripes TaxID=182062 RepID=A0A8H5GV54_9AGAR|nr:hypothetical protein D9758_003459 [Tetrapyrgos nigripes]
MIIIANAIDFSDPALKKLPLTFHQPFKGIYAFARISSLIVLIPAWGIYYSITRPRESWTVKECVSNRMIRWFMPLNSYCGLHPLSLDKTKEPSPESLKETSFIWIEPVEDSLIRGIALDDKVKSVRVPGYVWPKTQALEDAEDLVGLWIHGGGYMMGNASESFGESEIPRQLSKRSRVKNILSLDYRLVHEGCHPAQLLDALSAYTHLVKTLGISSSKIVFMGACAGGNLVPMLVRYLYEEKVLPLPAGMMLFSPVLDMVIDLEMKQNLSGPRPNTSIDMLATSHIPNVRLMGHNDLKLLASPYLSSNRAFPGSYKSYPPTFISIGDAEALKREAEQLHHLMKNDGVNVILDEQPDASHDFLGVPIIPNDKARENAIVRACEWIEWIGHGEGTGI